MIWGKHLPYPLVPCNITGETKPGYVVCFHLADGEPDATIGFLQPPKLNRLGIVLCAGCHGADVTAAEGMELARICCAHCVENGILAKLSAQA